MPKKNIPKTRYQYTCGERGSGGKTMSFSIHRPHWIWRPTVIVKTKTQSQKAVLATTQAGNAGATGLKIHPVPVVKIVVAEPDQHAAEQEEPADPEPHGEMDQLHNEKDGAKDRQRVEAEVGHRGNTAGKVRNAAEQHRQEERQRQETGPAHTGHETARFRSELCGFIVIGGVFHKGGLELDHSKIGHRATYNTPRQARGPTKHSDTTPATIRHPPSLRRSRRIGFTSPPSEYTARHV